MTQSVRFLEKWKARRRSAPGRLDVIPEIESRELGNRRDILVYLPTSYDKSDKPYPVIYMHDGQNLFDPATSFAGEWGVDSAMARAPRKGRRAIVVGIPNAGIERIREYSPFVDPRIGGGLGDIYLDWIENTVKPLIDTRYRTIREAAGTGIGGPSLGGLISLYAGVAYPELFGFIGAMSPSVRWHNSKIMELYEAWPTSQSRPRIYMDMGGREWKGAFAEVRELREVLEERGWIDGVDLQHIEDRYGRHHEEHWAKRLPNALRFMLVDAIPAIRREPSAA